MDLIKIDNLRFFANHGVFKQEQEQGQYFYADIRLYLDFKAAAETDDLTKTADYGAVCNFAYEHLTKNTFKLIETAADSLAEEILISFPLIREVFVEIKKPDAPIQLEFECVSVCTTRKWHRIFVAMGSNLGNKEENINKALKLLSAEQSIRIKKVSELIETPPYGYEVQPTFLNGAFEAETTLEPLELLRLLKEVEEDCGREKTFRWGPRIIDLDIIFYDDVVMDSEELTIPHREMHLRDFVKIPLCEIAPDFVHPVLKKRVCDL